MAEAEGISPTASVASVGPSIRYVGEFAYAYSGMVLCDDNATPLIEFTSGSGIIVANFQFNYGQEVNEKFEFIINLNALQVQEYMQNSSDDPAASSPHNLIPLIIPPFTTVQATAQNKSASNARNMVCTLTGRVYDA